jgi:hypothetical protein
VNDLLFIQLGDRDVLGFPVKAVEEECARTGDCERKGNECSFVMCFQLILPAVWLHLLCGGLVEILPNIFTDTTAGTILANLVTDAFRKATQVDVGLTANRMMHDRLMRGKSGVQTVYDVFAVAALGAGVVDTTAGSALVTG